MAIEDVRIHRIAAHPSTIEPGQISLMSSDDADMGFRAMGHKAHNGDVLIALAKDQIARVAQLHGNTRLDFKDSILNQADGGAGLSVRFADSMAEANDFLDDFGDISVMSAMKYLYDSGAGLTLDGAHANGNLITVDDGEGGVEVNVATDADSEAVIARTLNPGAIEPTLRIQNNGTDHEDGVAPTIQFDGNVGSDPSGHLLSTLNGKLSLMEHATESSPFAHNSTAYSRVYRHNTNPDLCLSVAELYAVQSINNEVARVQAKAWCGVDGGEGGSSVVIGATGISLSAQKTTLTGRIAYETGVPLTPDSGDVDLDFDVMSSRDIDLDNNESVEIELQEPADGPNTGHRSFGVVRLAQGATTATTSITWASSGSATVTWLTDSAISETLSAETYIEVWWDYGKWTLMKPGACGGDVSGLTQYQILTGAADGGIAQSGNFQHVSSGDVTLSSGSFKASTSGRGLHGVSDAYHIEEINFGLGTVEVEARDTTGEGGSASIVFLARESNTATTEQIQIVSGGAYSGSIAGTVSIRSYYMNLLSATGVNFNDSYISGLSLGIHSAEQTPGISSGVLSSFDWRNGAFAYIDVDENITSQNFTTPTNTGWNFRASMLFHFSGSYSVTGFDADVVWIGATPPISGTSGDEFIVSLEYRGSTEKYYATISAVN